MPELLYEGKDTYIISRTPKPEKGRIRFYTGSLKDLVLELKSQKGKTFLLMVVQKE